MRGLVEWAVKGVTQEMFAYFRAFTTLGLFQWSRQFEYPWIMTHGRFRTNELVLDAGGGNSCCLLQYFLADRCCHVVNLDIDVGQLDRNDPRILPVVGDILNIPFLNDTFTRVICVSVLEHLKDPQRALQELWRVTRPGGLLMVTMDVADRMLCSSTSDIRHGITEETVKGLLAMFGLETPPLPDDFLTHTLKEGDVEISLRVLCFCVEKPVEG